MSSEYLDAIDDTIAAAEAESLCEHAGDRYLSPNIIGHKRTPVRSCNTMKPITNNHHHTVTHNTYRKLRYDHDWGVCVRGAEPHPGDRIEVLTRAGQVHQETVTEVVWGNGSEFLVRIVKSTETGELGDATDEPVSTASKYPHLMREQPNRP